MSSHQETIQVWPVWELSIPLPAVLMITLVLYMLVLGLGLWIRSCLKDRCPPLGGCCPDVSLNERCFRFAEMCDCRLPTVRSCRAFTCPSCAKCDCACTCQPPECDTCNCLCFEIRIK